MIVRKAIAVKCTKGIDMKIMKGMKHMKEILQFFLSRFGVSLQKVPSSACGSVNDVGARRARFLHYRFVP